VSVRKKEVFNSLRGEYLKLKEVKVGEKRKARE
jgi:hypothetical protein